MKKDDLPHLAKPPKRAANFGIPGPLALIPGEDPAAYSHAEAMLSEHFQPAAPHQALIVQEIALHQWLIQRATRLQDDHIAKNGGVFVDSEFRLLIRYRRANLRFLRASIKMLLSTKKTRRKEFVSQDSGEPQTESKIFPEIPDRWAHNTAVRDPRTGDYCLLQVLRDREAVENERKRAKRLA